MQRFDGWIPISVDWQHSRPVVDWCRLGPLRFDEPFFEQTINRALDHPANLLFRRQTPIEDLGQWAAAQPGLAPTGFIFHMSRCGSTLLSQMLAALPGNLVISEARPVDAVLRSRLHVPDVTDEQRLRWLQWMVSAVGQPWRPDQKRFFIKFDSWHTLSLPLIRRAFPTVPWVFVYRQPAEVMMSHWRQRGPQSIPGVIEPGWFGWEQPAIAVMPPEEYAARVLARICEAALEQARQGVGKLVNYRQLPAIVLPTLMKFWGVEVSPVDAERMLDASRRDAKNPSLPFEGDTVLKQQRVSENISAAVQRWLEGPYQQLELVRTKQGFG
jgi:hypothetical protein